MSGVPSAIRPIASVTRRLEIDVGHRLMNHEGKCRNYHGHRYAFEITVEAPHLDAVGRVADFSIIKDRFGGWLDRYWDHGMILQLGDPLIHALGTQRLEPGGGGGGIFQESPKLCVIDCAPTAENLARIAFEQARILLPAPLDVREIVLYETPNCRATYPQRR